MAEANPLVRLIQAIDKVANLPREIAVVILGWERAMRLGVRKRSRRQIRGGWVPVPPWWYGPWAGTERMRRSNVRNRRIYDRNIREAATRSWPPDIWGRHPA